MIKSLKAVGAEKAVVRSYNALDNPQIYTASHHV